MKRFIFLIILTTIWTNSNSAQAQDIDGVKICDIVTREEIVNRFGLLEKYNFYKGDYGELYEEYVLDGIRLYLVDNELYNFVVGKSGIKVLSTVFNGGIEVGDAFDEILTQKLETDYVFKKHMHYDEEGVDNFQFYSKEHDVITLSLWVNQGIIFRISVDCLLD